MNYSQMCCCSLAGTAACDTCLNNPLKKYNNYPGPHITSSEVFRLPYDYYKTSDKTSDKPKTSDNKPKPVKPTVQYYCSLCDAIVDKYDKYCHNCGMPIDWSEYEKE